MTTGIIKKIYHNWDEFAIPVTSVNSQTGDVTISESDTKAFYLSSLTDYTNAKSALDWYVAGKNPIIIYDDKAYIVDGYQPDDWGWEVILGFASWVGVDAKTMTLHSADSGSTISDISVFASAAITNYITWTTSRLTNIWVWTQSEYEALSSYSDTVAYLIF